MGTKSYLLLVMLAVVAGCDSVDDSNSIDGLWRSPRPQATNELVVLDLAAGRFDTYNYAPGVNDWSCYQHVTEGTIELRENGKYKMNGDWSFSDAELVADGNILHLTSAMNGVNMSLNRDPRRESDLVVCD